MRDSFAARFLAGLLASGLLRPAAPGLGLAAEWVDQRMAGPFVCRADFSLAGYESLLGELAQVQRDLTQQLGVPPSREPAELYLFQGKRSYQDYLRIHYPQAPYRRALFIKGSGPGKVFVHKDLYRAKELPVDVRHESTHAMLHASLSMVPLWLDEGLAEYFEVPADKRAGGNPHLSAVVWNLRLGAITPLWRLEAKRDVNEMTAVDYRHAWAWVHFMLHGPTEGHEELVRFFADIQAGSPPGRLGQRLERRMPGVEKRLVEHFKTWNRRAKPSTPLVGKPDGPALEGAFRRPLQLWR